MDYARSLDELDPTTVADQALGALLRHVANLTLGWGVDLLSIRDLRDKTDVYPLMRRLTEFAQRGLPVEDWTEPTEIEEALERVLTQLYSSPCTRDELFIDVIDDTHPSSDYDYLHLALVAAVARWRLLDPQEVTTRGLDALASTVDRSWDDDDDRDRDDDEQDFEWGLPRRVSYVPAELAIAWLTDIGVPGFGARADHTPPPPLDPRARATTDEP